MHKYLSKIELNVESLMAIFIALFMGLFLVANYFIGFILPLYIVTILISTIITIKHPRAGLYAIIFLTFIFERFFTLVPIALGRNEYKLYPLDVLLVAILIGVIFQLAAGNLRLKLRNIDWLLVFFIALAVGYFLISTLALNSDASLAFSTAKNYAFYSLFYFVTYLLIDSKKYFKELLIVVLASAVGILWFVFYGILMRHGLWSDFTPLSTEGVRTLAFTHGYYLSMTLIVCLVYIAYKSDLVSKWLLVLTPFWVLGIIGSMMRHLWISLFVAIIFLIVLFARTERQRLQGYAKKYAVIALMLGVFIFYGAALFPRSAAYKTMSNVSSVLGSRVTSITNTSGDESIVWRSAVWQQATSEYMHSPIFGIGLGKKVSVEIGNYRDFVEVRNIHNSFLVILVQMGIFGLGSLMILVGNLSWKVFRCELDNELLQMSAYMSLGILIFQATAFLFQPYLEANLLGIFFWINLGILRRISEIRD